MPNSLICLVRSTKVPNFKLIKRSLLAGSGMAMRRLPLGRGKALQKWDGREREGRWGRVETPRRKPWLGMAEQKRGTITAHRENPNLALSGLPLNRVAIPLPNQKGRRGLQGEKQSMLWCLRHTGFKKRNTVFKKQQQKREMCLKFC